MAAPPTAYPAVNAVLDLLLNGVRAVLGDRLVGLYLYGSLASGDFDPDTSDIDFVAVTAEALPDELVEGLRALHARLAASGLKWAAKLEGAYIPRAELRRYDPQAGPFPGYNEGRFFVAPHGSDWIIQRHVLREWGVVLAGPDPAGLIDAVEPDGLRRAVLGTAQEWWRPVLADPAWLRTAEYQAFAVLSLCRALFTLAHGAIASKQTSGRWALGALDARWSALIDWALAWRKAPQTDRLDETLAFMRQALRQMER